MRVQPEVRDTGFVKGTGAPAKEDTVMSRSGFGRAEASTTVKEDKKEELKRPTYTNKRREDDGGFMSRSGMGTQKAEETKGAFGARGGVSTTTTASASTTK